MKGGLNKMMRNVVASTADSEYEKVSISYLPDQDLATHESDISTRFERTKREARCL